jgi:L-cysteine:1D-myo-inositol 2-amino-2-deoxy-alpha-D-glucopyranoside ligase
MILRNRVKAALNDDLDTPEALLLLKEAAETVAANHDLNTGAEILRLTTMLGLCM